MINHPKKVSRIKVGSLIVVAMAALGLLFWNSVKAPSPNQFHHEETHALDSVVTYYTCSMHPQIHQAKPGHCPICHMTLIPIQDPTPPAHPVTPNSTPDSTPEPTPDSTLTKTPKKIKYWQAPMDPSYTRSTPGKSPMGMDLVPVYEEEDDSLSNSPTLVLSKRAQALATVEVSPVIRAYASETLHLTGQLMVDETRLETISAWVSGRIEKLYIDYTGLTVDPHTHMATLYSPELRIAQKELLEAIRSQSTGLIYSSKEKLRLWGFSTQQIESIIRTGQVSDTLTLYAPTRGTVLRKYVTEGDYVSTGRKLYDIASLDRLWLMADVYESDVSKLRYGQPVRFTTLAYPGKIFSGTITFIDPLVNPKTRTIRIRAVVNNQNGELKPNMLAKVSVQILYGSNGPIQDHEVADLWTCPMHPEEFSKNPGKCAICGMALKRTTDLGFANTEPSISKPMLIPATAPLITGKRAIVYIQAPNKPGTYTSREIYLGPKVGDDYVVLEGLSEGDLVVTKGNFKLDSAMQIQAKPSMMQPDDRRAMTGGSH